MSDKAESKRVEALFGPYAGAMLDLPAADADAAIAEGWARDPFAPPADKPVEWTEALRDKVAVAAEKAARKMRGEEDAVKAKPAAKTEPAKTDADSAVKTTAMEAESATNKGGYETRVARSPKADT